MPGHYRLRNGVCRGETWPPRFLSFVPLVLGAASLHVHAGQPRGCCRTSPLREQRVSTLPFERIV